MPKRKPIYLTSHDYQVAREFAKLANVPNYPAHVPLNQRERRMTDYIIWLKQRIDKRRVTPAVLAILENENYNTLVDALHRITDKLPGDIADDSYGEDLFRSSYY